MSIIKGRITAGDRNLQGILIEAFDTPDDYQKMLPIKSRKKLGESSLTRIGSQVSDSNGEFEINYDDYYSNIANRPGVNLFLMASSCCKGNHQLEIIYQADIIRVNASPYEYYPICLKEDYTDDKNPNFSQLSDNSVETIKEIQLKEQELRTANLEVSREKFSARSAVRKDFDTKLAPQLRRNLSLVELDNKGKPIDPDYVLESESVRDKSETRMLKVLVKDLDVDSGEKMAMNGRVTLTPEQFKKLKSHASTSDSGDTITVQEDTLTQILSNGDGSGENPENGSQIVNRTSAVRDYCHSKTIDELCASDQTNGSTTGVNGVENGHTGTTNGDAGPERRLTDPAPGEDTDIGGVNITMEALKNQLPSYMAQILDENSILDSGTSSLPAPGTQLTEKDIASTSTFPSLTLPPGPADVPAYHDFYDLQIAFKPVWTEALDDKIVGDIGSFYEHYVEKGGDPAAFGNSINNGLTAIFDLSYLYNQLSVPDPIVQRHFDIRNEEWTALNADQHDHLKALANKIQWYYNQLANRFDNNMWDGSNTEDLPTYNRTREFLDNQVRYLSEQGQRIIRVARAELERQASNKSVVPNSSTLNQLLQRAKSSYPAKYFAANKQQRSVNFGLLINYRQRWTPTAYQVGELIKSIPLAPKEVRKYSKKIVKKERRSRKEIEANLESLKSETNSTTRAEADIVQKAMDKTNFNASANGSFTIGVWSGGGSTGLTQDAENNSSETKKSFHEAVVKAAREYKNEHKVELQTESEFESEFQESGEISNPNDELTVTYLFYELERRYRVEERLHRLTSVVLVAQEMPSPADIDEDWIIAHRWILNRVLLDDSFKQPLAYVAEGQEPEKFALEELRESMAQQRRLVEDLKEDVSDSRVLLESRYAALQRSMERTARAAQRKSKGGGIFGFAKKLTSLSVMGSFVDRLVGDDGESPEAARIREAASEDSYERELQRLRDLEGRLAQTNASLARATEEYTDRLSMHLGNVVLVSELKNHIKDNITHYMQAIWMHEPFQQRWLRLKDVPVPVMKRAKRTYDIAKTPIVGSLANLPHLKASTHKFSTTANVVLPPGKDQGKLETVPLYQVADIDGILGFRANYMIFPMKKANAITDFMMEPYVEKAAGGYGITDPDELGNISLDEFSEYVCCLKKRLNTREFNALKPELEAQLKKLLQSPLRNDEEVVVPMDATYIEALPGATPILENFKLLHRQIDAADAQEDLRLKKMEKIRYVQRLLDGRTDDPDSDARYEFTSNPQMDFAISSPGAANTDTDGS